MMMMMMMTTTTTTMMMMIVADNYFLSKFYLITLIKCVGDLHNSLSDTVHYLSAHGSWR